MAALDLPALDYSLTKPSQVYRQTLRLRPAASVTADGMGTNMGADDAPTPCLIRRTASIRAFRI